MQSVYSKASPRARRLLDYWETLDVRWVETEHPRGGKGRFVRKSQGTSRESESSRESRASGKENVRLACRDVTEEYRKNAKPGQGSVDTEPGYKRSKHKNEVEMANWIVSTFGGDVVLLNDRRNTQQKSPDFRWNDRLWELKTVEGLSGIDSAVHKALHQISNNPGGVILDFGDQEIDIEKAKKLLSRRMNRSGKSGTSTDGMIVMKSKSQYCMIRIEKEGASATE